MFSFNDGCMHLQTNGYSYRVYYEVREEEESEAEESEDDTVKANSTSTKSTAYSSDSSGSTDSIAGVIVGLFCACCCCVICAFVVLKMIRGQEQTQTNVVIQTAEMQSKPNIDMESKQPIQSHQNQQMGGQPMGGYAMGQPVAYQPMDMGMGMGMNMPGPYGQPMPPYDPYGMQQPVNVQVNMVQANPPIELSGTDLTIRESVEEPRLLHNGAHLGWPIKKIRVDADWTDQGFGNKKSRLWLRLYRGNNIVVDKDIFDICQRNDPNQTSRTYFSNDEIVNRSQPGDCYKLYGRSGGGGGHTLTVRSVKIVLWPDENDLGIPPQVYGPDGGLK